MDFVILQQIWVFTLTKTTTMLIKILNSIAWIFDNIWNLIVGIIVYLIAYFAEVKGGVHIMFFAFIADFFLGIIKSRVMNKEKFKMNKAFIAFMRFLISIVIISLLFGMDTEMDQSTISMYKIFTYLVTGAWIVSFADNGYQLTKWKPFLKVKGVIEDYQIKGKIKNEEPAEG